MSARPWTPEASLEADRDLIEIETDPVLAVFGRPCDLTDWRTARPPNFLVDGLLARGSLTVLSAKPGLMKSFLGLSLALHIAALEGSEFLGTYRVRSGGRVGILDGECGRERLTRRIRELVMGGELTAEQADAALANIFAFPIESIGERKLAVPTLDAWAERYKLDAVLVDPLRVFLPASVDTENGNLVMGGVFDSMLATAKRLNLAVFVAAHDNRTGGALRGAQSQADAAEVVLHLERDPNASDDTPSTLTVRKGRDYLDAPRIGVRVVRGNPVAEGDGWLHPLRLEGCLPPDAAQLTDRASWSAIRIHLERVTAASVAELIEATELPRSTVRDALAAAVAAGDAELTSESRKRSPVYRLAARRK